MIKDILFVDLDSTLRVTKSGKPYPIYKGDYKIVEPVVNYIKNLQEKRDYIIILVTNQSQIKSSEKLLDIYNFNLNDIISKLPFDIYHTFMAPTKDSEYRKPNSKAIVRDLLKMGISIGKNSKMIGDAGGRSGDFADSDLMFAISMGIKFIHTSDII